MTELILKGDIEKSKLDALINFLKSLGLKVELKQEEKKNKTKEFPFTVGMWKDYDIDGKELRRRAWQRGNDSI